jgi:glycosyltransferase involved in cell wall biosynthesis
MAARRAEIEANPLKKLYLWHQARKLRWLEESICDQFDVNLAVSELDAQTLLERNPRAHFRIVENGTDTEYFHPSDAEPEPNTLVFAGSLNWYPNLSAIRYFDEQIWPLIKLACPDARFYIAGQKPPGWLRTLAERDPNVTLIPSPQDIRPAVARAAVFVCPILDGGGTKVKVLDALAMGKAVVSTSVGCEGLAVEHQRDVLIADAPKDFAAYVQRLLSHRGLRAELGISGRRVVERAYSWQAVGHRLEGAYDQALALPKVI